MENTRTLTVIGLGLIGGSMAVDLKHRGFVDRVIGVDLDPLHAEAALRLKLVDEVMDLAAAVQAADLVLVAVPVSSAIALLPQILDLADEQTVVTDVGSTKSGVIDAVRSHPRRGRFVGSHPMAGTENSGPWAALSNLFDGKAGIICDAADSDADAVATVERMYSTLNMRQIRLSSSEHDEHVAYVSHISHVISFALALTVLDKEKDESRIFDLASGGFGSTARLAKSDASMWVPIFSQNSKNVLNVLDAYLEHLGNFREILAARNEESLEEKIREANQIRRVLAG